MKKNIFFLSVISFMFFIACRNSEDTQFIDQKIQIFIDSAGQDMLNSKINGSYIGYTINDVYGATDVVPVPMTLKKTADTINYLEYIAGAKRIAMDANNPPQNYQSKIAFAFQKKLGNNTVITNDTLVLNYTISPTLFQINNATYNGISVFTKNPNTDNIIKIFK